MPLTGDEYRQRSQEDILAFLEAELRAEWGEDIDLTESSVFRTFAEALSSLDAEELEPALAEVHESAFLDTAEDELLERLVAIIGLTRRSATHATGTIRFDHGATVAQDYTIDNGSIVQTDSNDPVQFETINRRRLSLFDDFETGAVASYYGGTVASFDVVDDSGTDDPTPTEGDYQLRADPTAGDKLFVGGTTDTAVGSTMDFRVYLQDSDATANSQAGNLFGVIDGDNYYRIRLDSSGEHAIEVVTTGGGTISLSSNAFSVPENEWLRNEVEWSPEGAGTITSKLYNSNGTLIDEVSVTDEDRITEGGYGFEQLGSSENVYWDHSGERSVLIDSRARQAGTVGNIGANSLTVMPSVPSGIESVTNPYPMGGDDHFLTSLLQFDVGRPRETDQQLRDRAGSGEGTVGKATVPALIAAARNLAGAESVTVYENKENSTVDGLPPKSFELVYYGVDDTQTIADMLHETKAFTSRDFGGAHGAEVTETVQAENGQTFTYRWTEPTELDVDITLDIVANDSFIGKDELRDRVVSYIGGTLSDGTRTLGTGVGENVFVDQIEDEVTGPSDTGVIGISSYSFTPAVTTDANGLEVVDVGANEVATTSGEDASITINVTYV